MFSKSIFIVGSGRCGTSWLQKWMLQHPKCFGVYNEAGLFYDIHCISRFQPNKIIKDNRPGGHCHINEWVEPSTLMGLLSDFVYNVFDATYNKHDKPYLVEKTPRHIWDVELINGLLKRKCEVYFIHIYRDGRNVLESFLRQNWIFGIEQIVNDWIQIMSFMLNGDFPENTIHIRYEDLVKDAALSRTITEFCGIEHHSDIEPFQEICGPNAILDFDADRHAHLYRYEKIKPFLLQMEPVLQKLGYPVGHNE